jgi:hypothetical protein
VDRFATVVLLVLAGAIVLQLVRGGPAGVLAWFRAKYAGR